MFLTSYHFFCQYPFFHIVYLEHHPFLFLSQLFGKVEAAERVITYAASCGSTKVDDLSDELREAIKSAMSNLSVVSVRDKNTADLF